MEKATSDEAKPEDKKKIIGCIKNNLKVDLELIKAIPPITILIPYVVSY